MPLFVNRKNGKAAQNRVSQETGWGIVDIHWNDELFHEGSNTVKFEISFGYAKNDGTIASEIIGIIAKDSDQWSAYNKENQQNTENEFLLTTNTPREFFFGFSRRIYGIFTCFFGHLNGSIFTKVAKLK